MNRIICSCCGRDINSLGQDNMSYNNHPICEDCYYQELSREEAEHNRLREEQMEESDW